MKCKFFEKISEENINKAIKQLKSEGNNIIGKPNLYYLEDNFIIFYKERDKTTPLEEDIKKHIYPQFNEKEIIETQKQFNPIDWNFLLKKYWYIPLLVALAIGYYIFYYK